MTEAELNDWFRTGRVRCDNCLSLVTTRTLETLPPHDCVQRAAARRAQQEH